MHYILSGSGSYHGFVLLGRCVIVLTVEVQAVWVVVAAGVRRLVGKRKTCKKCPPKGSETYTL